MSPLATWTHAAILGALQSDRPTSPGQANLVLEDLAVPLGIGRDHEGLAVVVVPPGAAVTPYEGDRATFIPLTAAMPSGSGQAAVTAGVLSFSTEECSEEVLSAIASAIAGLVQITRRGLLLDAAKSAAGLARLIDQGFIDRPSTATIEGVMGELIVLLRAARVDDLFDAWHSDPRATFDFSIETSRLEVKTTTTSAREHEFSSGQLSEYALPTDIASVILQVVEEGATLGDLVAQAETRLHDGRRRERLWAQVENIVGLPVELIERPTIDVAGSASSLQIWAAESLPQPKMADGVLWMRWKAALSGDPVQRDPQTDLVRALLG